MTDRPILFSAPMVRAILAGRKTQTRRVLRNPEYYGCPTGDCPHEFQMECNLAMANLTPEERGYKIGDRLWVKETWQTLQGFDDLKPSLIKPDAPIGYLAGGGITTGGKTRVSIFMPRWASRLTLIVTDVRVEQLQDVSPRDAEAEGVFCHVAEHSLDKVFKSDRPRWAISYFKELWDSINGKREGASWDDNPWVVAVSFTVEQRNIDR